MLNFCRHETQGFLRFPTTTRPPHSLSSKPLCSPPIVMTLLVIIRSRRVAHIGRLCLIVSPHFAQTCLLLSVPWCSSSPILSHCVIVNDLPVYQTTTRYCYSHHLGFIPSLWYISVLQNSFTSHHLVSMDSYKIGASGQSISATYLHLALFLPLVLMYLYLYTYRKYVALTTVFHFIFISLHGYASSQDP